MDINYSGIRVKAATVRVLIGKADHKSAIPLMMLFPSFDAEHEKIYRGLAFLLLDGALGEYDVETKVSHIDIGSTDHPSVEHSYSLNELPKAFAERFEDN